MARSDFNYLPVNHTFTANAPVFDMDFPVELSAGQAVVDDGYLALGTQRFTFSQKGR
jgi:hypothetical protein